MSIIDNLLILLDDNKPRSINNIYGVFNKYSKQVIAASLGRLASKKLVVRTNNNYKITKLGQLIITQNLSIINKLDNKLTDNIKFIIFNIPEKERINRDIFRNFLINNGYGRLHNTVWIGLNKNKLLEKTISDLGINKNVLMFSVKLSKLDYIKVIKKTQWNFNKINHEYSKFIKYANKFLSTNKDKTQARCLVYFYSKILKMDPALENKFLSSNYLGRKSNKLYNKIRNYCL